MSDFPKLPRVKADDEAMERLHAAARKGETEEVQRLIATGIDPAIPNRFGCTALHLACKHGRVETAQYLSSVCDVQSAWHGQRPLQLAVLSNQLPLVTALVEGAKARGKPPGPLLDECDDTVVTQVGTHFKRCKGQTALHWCIGLGPDYVPMLKLLVELGANPSARDKDGETCVMRAIEFHHTEALALFLRPGVRLEAADGQGRGVLHWAALHNNEAAALRMLDLGAPIDAEDEEHIVPFVVAIRAAMVDLTDRLLRDCDPFTVQNCTLHNGRTVQAERIKWLDFVADSAAQEKAAAEAEELRAAFAAADAEAAKEKDAAAAGAASNNNNNNNNNASATSGVTVSSPTKSMSVDERKRSVVSLLQRRLDAILAPPPAEGDAAGAAPKKRKVSVKKMNLAPSAPVRGSSKTRSGSVKRKSTLKK